MTQSRRMSAVEAVSNVVVGWFVALLGQLVLFPVIGLQVTLTQNMTLSACFTCISIARSYLLRRLFERVALRRGQGA